MTKKSTSKPRAKHNVGAVEDALADLVTVHRFAEKFLTQRRATFALDETTLVLVKRIADLVPNQVESEEHC